MSISSLTFLEFCRGLTLSENLTEMKEEIIYWLEEVGYNIENSENLSLFELGDIIEDIIEELEE